MEFIRVVGLDHFFHALKNKQCAFLDQLCWGIKPSGLSEVLMVDQEPEFKRQDFPIQIRELGVPVQLVDGQSPGQNDSTERANGTYERLSDKIVDTTARTDETEYFSAVDVLERYAHLPDHLLSDSRLDPNSVARSQPTDVIQRRGCIQENLNTGLRLKRSTLLTELAVSNAYAARDTSRDAPKMISFGKLHFGGTASLEPSKWPASLCFNAVEAQDWPQGAMKIWQCRREQARPATEDQSLSKEVTSTLSKELFTDLETNRCARYLDVTVDELLETWDPSETRVSPTATADAVKESLALSNDGSATDVEQLTALARSAGTAVPLALRGLPVTSA